VFITEAGNAPDVVGLVHIAAFIPDQGESAIGLLSQSPAANNDLRATQDDFLSVDPDALPADFAADVPPVQANFMDRSQTMLAKAAAGAPVGSAAWLQSRPQMPATPTSVQRCGSPRPNTDGPAQPGAAHHESHRAWAA
jgi:hypothetical protein